MSRAMNDVFLRGPSTVAPIDPGALAWKAEAIEPSALAFLHRKAFRAGRVIARDGATLLSTGIAATIECPRGLGAPGASKDAFRLLSHIAPVALSSSTPAPVCPVAIAALPFDNHAPSRLVIPTLAVHESTPNAATAVAVAPTSELDAIFEALRVESAEPEGDKGDDALRPDRFTLESIGGHEEFLSRVADAIAAIRSGAFDKVVLAREVLVRANRPFAQRDLLERMRVLHPSCASFAIDGFFGASPELLCKKHGPIITTQPLAGTIPRSGDPADDAIHAAGLLSSKKDRAEHRFVVDDIARELARFTPKVDVPNEPHLLELRNVTHLATRIVATLPEGRDEDGLGPSVLEIVAALHPTPAVGGVPRKAALEYLAAFETVSRDRFAGPIGWVDAAGDGEWWIGIRSAMVHNNNARLLAGVGIVRDSDPYSELVETQLKFQAFLATAVRP
jgi:menaquinone-specific isochorismate synthase